MGGGGVADIEEKRSKKKKALTSSKWRKDIFLNVPKLLFFAYCEPLEQPKLLNPLA